MFLNKLSLFWALTKVDLLQISKRIRTDIIDNLILVTLIVIGNAYIMPLLGMTTQYGPIVATGMIVSLASFQTYHACIMLISDYDSDKTLQYELTLPTTFWQILLKKVLALAIRVCALTITVIPLAKMLMPQLLDLSNFAPIKFGFSMFSICLTSGVCAIFLSSIPKNLNRASSVWIRIVFPLWFFGGSFFPYSSIVKAFPKVGWLFALNPVVYLTEGIRGSVLGRGAHFMPLLWCYLVSVIFICTLFMASWYRLKKKLDFV